MAPHEIQALVEKCRALVQTPEWQLEMFRITLHGAERAIETKKHQLASERRLHPPGTLLFQDIGGLNELYQARNRAQKALDAFLAEHPELTPGTPSTDM